MTTPDGKSKYAVRFVEWKSHEAQAVKMIRFRVFVDEQKVPAELELDHIDSDAFHVLAVNNSGDPCGTGRLFTDSDDPALAHIGRMAVLKPCRGTGCGAAILTALLNEARRKLYKDIELSAQVHALAFYQQFGFEAIGQIYDDAGIPHQTMMLRL